MVIGNYGMNFRPGLKRDRTQTNFYKFPKWKMETLVFSLALKKSKLFLIFFLLDRRDLYAYLVHHHVWIHHRHAIHLVHAFRDEIF